MSEKLTAVGILWHLFFVLFSFSELKIVRGDLNSPDMKANDCESETFFYILIDSMATLLASLMVFCQKVSSFGD